MIGYAGTGIVSYGKFRDDDDAIRQAAAMDEKHGTAVAEQLIGQAMGSQKVGVGGWMGFISDMAGAASTIVGGTNAVAAAKHNAAATVANARANFMTSAVALRGAALDAKVQIIAIQENAKIKRAQLTTLTTLGLVLGGGSMLVTMVLIGRKK
jgi:hypothetical protein